MHSTELKNKGTAVWKLDFLILFLYEEVIFLIASCSVATTVKHNNKDLSHLQ